MNSNMALYVTAELAVLLLFICAFLLFHIRSLKKLISRLEAKVLELRNTVVATKNNAKSKIQEVKSSFREKTYLDYIEQQIDATKDHHASQSPDRDIVLDLDTDIPEERQIAALRHAFLVMEKEAQYAAEDDSAAVWPIIHAKLQQIIHFYRTAFQGSAAATAETATSEPDEMLLMELQNYKQRVENLDKFKKLFFDMEKQWDAARRDAERYRAQLSELTQGHENAGAIERVLDQYASAYNELQSHFDDGADLADGGDARRRRAERDVDNRRPVAEPKVIITHQDELVRLRKMMVDQHNIIADLKNKLRENTESEDQLMAVEQLSRELEKQERLMRESETCIKLLEDELHEVRTELMQAKRENTQLHEKQSSRSEKEVEEMIAGHVAESRDMMTTIAQLDRENKQLKERLAKGGGSAADGGDAEETERLRTKLGEVQQELLNLQTQHIELEERYIELKTSSMR